jgi:hypothetical protein
MTVEFIKDDRGNDIIQINDGRIMWPNFAGRESQFNDKGKRNFNWKIEGGSDLIDRLVADGWNVKIKPPREEGDEPFVHMAVKVNFEGWNPPNIYLVSGDNVRKLDADTVSILDDIRIEKADFDIRAYDYDTPRGSGRAAYLHGARIVQRLEYDRFAPIDDDIPFEME